MERVYTQTFSAAGAIIERDGKFLLVKEHRPGHPVHGKWNQPAGWINLGESPVDAVVREVKEETGLAFLPTHLLGVYSLVKRHNYNIGMLASETVHHSLKLVFVGTCVGQSDTFASGEISETKWFSPEEIYEMDSAALRDSDIKKEMRDYLAGKRYPLELITHTIQE